MPADYIDGLLGRVLDALSGEMLSYYQRTHSCHVQEDSCCTDPHRWMKPLVCPQDFLDSDVCALHFVGWRKSGMPAVYEVSATCRVLHELGCATACPRETRWQQNILERPIGNKSYTD